MRRVAAGFLVVASLACSVPLTSSPVSAAPPSCGGLGCFTGDGGGDRGTIEVGGSRGSSDIVPGRGSPATHGEAPGRLSWLRVDEIVVLACSTNTRTGGTDMCAYAAETCPSVDQLRYWIWHQETRVTIHPDGTRTESIERPWDQEPGSYCLGPDDPGVPTIGHVIARVQAEFQSLPLPSHAVRTDPNPVTLVNIPTAFSAGDARPVTFTPTILGTTVTITATPTAWEWTFGDGGTATTSIPGRPQHPDVAHTYTTTGSFQSTVRITWTGTFTLPGSAEVFDIRNPAFTQAPPITVDVREARAQLIAAS